MIKEITMYGAQCNHCKKDWYSEYNDWVAMNDKGSIQEILSDEGWFEDKYCPKCWSIDEEDNIILKGKSNP